jgi:hypothetical protein
MPPNDYADWSFTLVTPSTPGSYSLSMAMVHAAGWDYHDSSGSTCASGPGSDTIFGQTATLNFTVAPPVVPTITYNITYSAAPLNTPSNVNFTIPACGQIAVNWDYTSNSVEEYFTVWRSTSSSLATFTQVSGNIAPNLRTFTDTPPTTNQSYYYQVRAHTTIGGTRETQSAITGPVFNASCSSIIGLDADLIQINGVAYSPTAVIKNGDVLKFQLTLSNSGTASATINYFCTTPSNNLTSLSSLASTSGSVGSITTDSSACPGTNAKRLNVSGVKTVGNPNWLVTFTATFAAQTQDGYEVCSNIASVNFSDVSAANQSVTDAYGPILCKTNRGTAPDVREVAP